MGFVKGGSRIVLLAIGLSVIVFTSSLNDIDIVRMWL